jgi:general secretion pathway protein A
LIAGLEGSMARLVNADGETKVPLTDIQLVWFEDFTLLWRTPPGYESPMRLGREGKAVVWLASQLAALQGETIVRQAGVFDRELATRLRRFQMQQGLLPDGVAGPQTLIRLNRSLGLNAPLLNDSGKAS